LATGNSFASLHFEYLLGETTMREIVRDTCEAIWECLLPDYMPPKNSDDWLKIEKFSMTEQIFLTALVPSMENILE
jgi:hypothetical protein